MSDHDGALLSNASCSLRLQDGAIVRVRAIQPDDAGYLGIYLRDLSAESRRNRLLGTAHEFSPAILDRILRQDGGHALLAFADSGRGKHVVAEAMQAWTTDAGCREVAVSVADAWQRRGLGTFMVSAMERRARKSGARCLFGDVLRTNVAMKSLARKLGFLVRSHWADATQIVIVKALSSSRADASINNFWI